MKILTVTTTFPYPPHDGTKIQIFHRVRNLSASNNVSLLSVVDHMPSEEFIKEMEKYCTCHFLIRPPLRFSDTPALRIWNFLRSVAAGGPYYEVDQHTMVAQQWIRRNTEHGQFDVVEADCSAAVYLQEPMPALRVWIMHSVECSNDTRRLKMMNVSVKKLTVSMYALLRRSLQGSIARSVDISVVLTPQNLAELRRFDSRINAQHILSNGIDLDYFSYADPSAEPEGVCFVGKLDHDPNEDAVLAFSRSVWPHIRKANSHARFFVVGSNPPAAVRALDGTSSITVTGRVPDVRPYLRRAGIAVVPIRTGGGILNKVLEAMSMGIPVVTRSMGIHGLQAVPGRDLLVCDDDREFTETVNTLLSDPELRLRIARSARAYVETHHQWSAIVGRYESALRTAVTKTTAYACGQENLRLRA